MTGTDTPRRTELLTADLAETPAIERAQLARIELLPGQAPGAHHHPCDVIGTVTAGSIRFQIEGQDETVLHTGDAFFEPRNTHVLRFDNASHTEPAAFFACYLLGPSQTEVIAMAPPAERTE